VVAAVESGAKSGPVTGAERFRRAALPWCSESWTEVRIPLPVATGLFYLQGPGDPFFAECRHKLRLETPGRARVERALPRSTGRRSRFEVFWLPKPAGSALVRLMDGGTGEYLLEVPAGRVRRILRENGAVLAGEVVTEEGGVLTVDGQIEMICDGPAERLEEAVVNQPGRYLGFVDASASPMRFLATRS